MGIEVRLMVEGEYACYTRPEFKVERVSYDVPPVSAIEGLLKSIYWKPAFRYVVDKIIVFNPIRFTNIRRNECKSKVLLSSMQAQMRGEDKSPVIYTENDRTQRTAMILKNVKYGIEFHIEMTGIKSERSDDTIDKHFYILHRRLEKGQWFRQPCLGCSEFPARKIELVKEFDLSRVAPENMGDKDLGFMLYGLNFKGGGLPVNGDWENPVFSNLADSVYYRPHIVDGVIDVNKYRGMM